MATQRKRTTTVHLTRRTFDALQQRARRAGKNADALADEILRDAIKQPAERMPGESERDYIHRILLADGVIVDPSEYGFKPDPNVDVEAAIRELRSIHFDPPLSETIIEDRHRR